MAFIGREKELDTLKRLADDNQFRMIVVYGRRRIGKTSLLMEFARNRRTLAFTAEEVSDQTNLRNFSMQVRRFFQEPENYGPFPTWDGAFDYIADKARQDPEHPILILFDEFPYAAEAQPSLPSILQVAIDHKLLGTNATLVLCGSNEGFMERRVLGAKSPLYGRRDAQIHLRPFDIFDAVKLMPKDATWEEKIEYYATFGGTPYYLARLRDDLGFEDNVRVLMYRPDGLLYEEPVMLMRQELREPAVYTSVMDEIGHGNNRVSLIADGLRMNVTSLPFYLNTLRALGLIDNPAPFGEGHMSRKARWIIKDPFFAYWFKFVAPVRQLIETGRGERASKTGASGEVFQTYVGQQYENICVQWLLRQYDLGLLPFDPLRFGKWWGNDPQAKQQTDIDIVMDNTMERRLLLGECKWRNHLDETETIRTLEDRRRLIKGNYDAIDYYLFTKHNVSDATILKHKAQGNLNFVSAADMLKN